MIGKFFQTTPPRSSAGLLSKPHGEVDRPTNTKNGTSLRKIIPSSRIGPINEINRFSKEGSAGFGVEVPNTSNPELLICVIVCTEVQNCRQIAAINTVILTEKSSNETSEGSGKVGAQNVSLKAKGNLEHEQLPLQDIIWSVVQ